LSHSTSTFLYWVFFALHHFQVVAMARYLVTLILKFLT
jgi:hypothetical protein